MIMSRKRVTNNYSVYVALKLQVLKRGVVTQEYLVKVVKLRLDRMTVVVKTQVAAVDQVINALYQYVSIYVILIRASNKDEQLNVLGSNGKDKDKQGGGGR